ncbi:MAG: hypothetical protein IPO43_13665 [Rhodoferax sp.]|nr:hypothetical protein [Rhodoferax sp.]
MNKTPGIDDQASGRHAYTFGHRVVPRKSQVKFRHGDGCRHGDHIYCWRAPADRPAYKVRERRFKARCHLFEVPVSLVHFSISNEESVYAQGFHGNEARSASQPRRARGGRSRARASAQSQSKKTGFKLPLPGKTSPTACQKDAAWTGFAVTLKYHQKLSVSPSTVMHFLRYQSALAHVP